jgi:hypothetical protein
MSILIRYIWCTKVFLTGWSAYKACSGDTTFICVLSGSYFLVLLCATAISWTTFQLPRRVDSLEGEYLRKLEEGIAFELSNKKSE